MDKYEGYTIYPVGDAFAANDDRGVKVMQCGTLERLKTMLLVLNKANHTGEPVQDTEEEA